MLNVENLTVHPPVATMVFRSLSRHLEDIFKGTESPDEKKGGGVFNADNQRVGISVTPQGILFQFNGHDRFGNDDLNCCVFPLSAEVPAVAALAIALYQYAAVLPARLVRVETFYDVQAEAECSGCDVCRSERGGVKE